MPANFFIVCFGRASSHKRSGAPNRTDALRAERSPIFLLQFTVAERLKKTILRIIGIIS